MKFISINGVSLNTHSVLKMGKEKFLSHPMHDNHWKHLKAADREKAKQQAWELISGETTENVSDDINGNDRIIEEVGSESARHS